MKDYTIFEEIKYINTLLGRRFFENFLSKQTASLTRENYFIIKYLINNQDKEIFQKDIEEKFGITKSTASTVLKLMESKNLIKRESISSDARYKKIVLTDESLKINNLIQEYFSNDNKLLLSNFSFEELETFKILLKKLKENIKNTDKKGEQND